MYRCKKFVFLYKEERYESQNATYLSDVLLEIKDSFAQGAVVVNESRKKKIERIRKKSEGGVVSAIRRKLSTDVITVKSYCDDADAITQNDVDLLDLDVQQNGGDILVTVLNDIDPIWFRKSVKIFFQWQLLQNGLI